MNLLSVPPIISALVFLLLGGFIYFQDRKSKTHLAFLLICLTTFWWQVSWFFLFNTQNEALANILVKIGHVGIILLPVTFLYFILSFLEKTDRFNRATLYLSCLVALFFEISLFATDYFINGYYKYFWGFYPKANFLHLFYLLLIAALLIRAVYLLLGATKKESKESIRRHQMEYILVGIIFYTFAASDFFVNYGFEFYPIGFIPILFFLAAIGYAIAKYRLMNIRIILTESLTAVIAFILLAQVFISENNFEYIWRGALFVAFLFLGYMLIRSVLKEIKAKEEMAKLSAELKKAYDDLQVLDKAKSEFISMASHQLRTPLSAIKGYISMLAEGSYGKMPPKARDKLINVAQSSERLIRIINDLLNISRIEMGKMELEMEVTRMDDLVQSCYEEMKIAADQKGLKITLKKPEYALPKITIDALKVRQVILNLIDNAIHYTQKGEIEVGVDKVGSAIRAWIKDTGEGLSEKEKNEVFGGFTRGSAGLAYFVEGAGLGLHVAKKFLELHHGKIWVDSEGKGKGSTFFVELPIE